MSSVSKKHEQADPKATVYPQATDRPVHSARRHLDPELAQAIKEAKLKTGSSWRRVAKYTGLSHSYLVQLSNGQRVPSTETVDVLAEWLPIEEWAVEALRDLADRGWARDDQNVSSPNPSRYDSTGSIVPVMSHG